MPDTSTTNYSLIKPEDGGSPDTWGAKTNANWDIVDAKLKELEDVTDQFGAISISAFALTMLDDADASEARTTLGLGTSALKNTGTSGDAVPLLNALNNFSAGLRANGNTLPASGAGLELRHSGSQAFIYSISRDTGEIMDMVIGGLPIELWAGTPTPNLGIQVTNSEVKFPSIGTTASSANAFLDAGVSNSLKRVSSAEVFKRDIEPIDPAFSYRVLNELDPIWYRSNTDLCVDDNPEWSWWGFSADQAARVDPRLVQYGYADSDYDVVEEDGRALRVLREGAEPRPIGFNYDRAPVHHHVILREHDRILNELRERVEALEARG